MDKKTKILNIIFWLVILLSICFTFYKTIIKQDFSIINYSEDSSGDIGNEENVVSEEI
jgi:hypothetical protein